MKAELFTRPGCGYCVAAKQLLVKKNISYVEHDITNRADGEEIKSRVPGFRTVPQIFLDGQHIGGFDDLVRHFAQTAEARSTAASPQPRGGVAGRLRHLLGR